MTKFDDKTMRAFEKYLELQKSGKTNMVSSRVQDMLGISKDEHIFIMTHYSELLDEYNSLKVVDEVIADAKERVGDNHAKSKGKGFKGKEVVEDLDEQELD